MIFQIKEINGEYLLQHVMQEIIIFALSKARVYPYLGVTITNKAHDIIGLELILINFKDILIPYLIPILIVVLRKDQQIGIVIKA